MGRATLETLPERFWAKVGKTETCWLWEACKNEAGYGLINVEGRSRLSHRIAYEMLVGPIPDGLHLDHTCRVRHCVNPAHLEPVTNAENTRRGMWGNRQTCDKGHAYTVENVYIHPQRGTRMCRTCLREAARRNGVKYRERRRARRHAA